MRTILSTRSGGGPAALPTRWAAAPTLLVALANVPIAFQPDDNADLAAAVRWAVTGLGVLGLVAGAALLARVRWAAPLALALGALNAVAGLIVLVRGNGSGVVGLVLGLLAVALTLVPGRRPAPAASAA